MTDDTDLPADPYADAMLVEPERPSAPTITTTRADASSLQGSMKNFDDTTAATNELRYALINKFLPEIWSFDLTDKSVDSETLQSQARFFSEVRQLLNDIDSSMKNHVTVKMKNVDMEHQHENTISPAELLAAIRLKQPMQPIAGNRPSADEVDRQLEARFKADGGEILDTELEMGGNNLPVGNELDDR